MYERTVWRSAADEEIYEPRCSYCGQWRRNLMKHWFFTGLYCIRCIHECLYNDVRNVDEINRRKHNES